MRISLSLLGNGSVKCIYPFIARQRLGKYVLVEANTRNDRRIVGRVCLYPPVVARQQLGKDAPAATK
jgi:hypothetical protein